MSIFTFPVQLHDSNLLADSCYKSLTRNHTLHKFFANSGKCLFKCDAFKHHWLVHAVRLSRFINPLHLSCYRGESFAHTMKTLMHSQVVSRKPLSSMTSFTPRYCLALTSMQTQRSTGKNHAQVLALQVLSKKDFCVKLYVCLFPCTAMVSFTSCLKFASMRKNCTRKKS